MTFPLCPRPSVYRTVPRCNDTEPDRYRWTQELLVTVGCPFQDIRDCGGPNPGYLGPSGRTVSRKTGFLSLYSFQVSVFNASVYGPSNSFCLIKQTKQKYGLEGLNRHKQKKFFMFKIFLIVFYTRFFNSRGIKKQIRHSVSCKRRL